MKFFKFKAFISVILIALLTLSTIATPVFADDVEPPEEEDFISDLDEGAINTEDASPDESRQEEEDESTVVAPPVIEDVPVDENEEIAVAVPDTMAYRFFLAADFLAPQIAEMPANAPMTRAQFVSIVSRMCAVTGLDGGWDKPFWDVPSNHWCAPYIYALRDLGYINGFSEHEFKPDNTLTWGQVIKISVEILGYGKVAREMYGDYPDAYLIQASKLKLPLDDISINETAKNEDVLDFLLEVAQTKILEQPSIKPGVEVLEISEDTLLSKYHEIYEGNGMMTFNGETGLNTSINAGKGEVIIGGKKLDQNNLYTRDLLGMNVTYYYQKSNGPKDVLIYVEGEYNHSNVLIIDREDLAVDDPRFSVNTICYYDAKGRVKTVQINPLARFIYNGRAKDNYDYQDYIIEAGTLKLISYNGLSSYDVIIAEEFKNCFVSMVDTKNKRLHDVYGTSTGTVLDFEQYDNVEIYKNGVAITIDQINKNDVVSYMEDENKELLILHVLSDKISGTVSTDGNSDIRYRTYTIDGNEYRLAANVREALADSRIYVSEPVIGEKYDFYLDMSGRIGGIVEVSQKLSYSLLCKYGQGSGFDSDRLILQLVLDNGELTEVQTASKFVVKMPQLDGSGIVVLGADGRVLYQETTYNASQATVATIKGILDTYSRFPLLRVQFNGSGEVVRMELAEDTSKLYDRQHASGDGYYSKDDDYNWNYGYDAENFNLDYYNANAQHRGSSIMTFVGHYRMNPDTVVFNIPCYENMTIDDVDPRDIKVIESVNLWHGAQYNVALYDADATLSADAVVVSPVYPSYFNGIFVVDKVARAINTKGESVYKVSGWQKGVYLELVENREGLLLKAKSTFLSKRDKDLDSTHVDVTNVLPGDVFRLANADGEIIGAQLFYSCSGAKFPIISSVSTPTEARLYSSATIAVGQVYAMSPYAISTINPAEVVGYTNKYYGKISSHTLYNTVVTVYDSQRKRVELGSLADVDVQSLPHMDGTLSDAENNNSWVVIYRSGDMVYEMVVIK